MPYDPPLADIRGALRRAGLDAGMADGLYPDLSPDLVDAVLDEAAKFARDRLAPLNWPGDRHGTPFKDGVVTTPPGVREAYRDWAAAGWNGLAADPAHGGQGLPALIQAAANEMWNGANMAFALNPLLTAGAIEALSAHGSDALKAKYLARLVSGEWTGTMNLTEPQAGSDLSAVRTRANRGADGTYRITGTKIYITYGEHDLSDNILHLVLARIDGAPAGTRGISLFLVPKFMVGDDGSLGARNDVRCSGIEHKLGINASPTCTMVYGDRGGAVGFLVGEENRGLNCMFTMMNEARLGVGVQGVAVADAATQRAEAFARERRQGKTAAGQREMSPIAEHPDVRRMLLTMRTRTLASRAICYATAAALGRARLHADPAERARAADRAALLTPVAKAYATDAGVEVASLGVQVHGGMGFVEETGAAQLLRDSRILPIYEGTNGIQAIDLVTRKLPLDEGRAVAALLGEYRDTARRLAAVNDPALGRAAPHLAAGVDALERATGWLLRALPGAPADALAGATPYLRLFGVVAGGAALAEAALEARAAGEGAGEAARELRFHAEDALVLAPGLALTVEEGAEAVNGAHADPAMRAAPAQLAAAE